MTINDHIAEAAKAFIHADEKNSLDRIVGTAKARSEAYNKLHWMVHAEMYGWNPEEYQPEE